MRSKFLLAFVVALMLVGGSIGVSPVRAGAYNTPFTTSITYQNVGTGDATIQFMFYADPTSTTPIIVDRTLGAGQSASLFIGSVSTIGEGFRGSAVIQADQPILATMVQVPQGTTTIVVRPLSNGFSEGGAQALIATVLKNKFGAHTIFSVQNVDTQENTVTIKFYDTSATLKHTITQAIKPGAAYYVDAANVAALGTDFNGSAVVEAKRADNSAGKIVGTAMELDITGKGAKAFESVAAGAMKVYMPSALCNAFGGQNTAYAVQNTSLTQATSVTVTYQPGNKTETQTIGPGAKYSFIACNAGVGNNFSGSAVIESATQPIVAIGKAYGGGLSTAFLGEAMGYSKLALPYVRWAPDAYYNNGSRQRTFIAIQNVGTAEIPAGALTIQYTDPFGHVGTHTNTTAIAAGAKFNSNASLAGLTWFGMTEPPAGAQYGGGAMITCSAPNCQIIAVARVQTRDVSAGNNAGEDYNGLPVP